MGAGAGGGGGGKLGPAGGEIGQFRENCEMQGEGTAWGGLPTAALKRSNKCNGYTTDIHSFPVWRREVQDGGCRQGWSL